MQWLLIQSNYLKLLQLDTNKNIALKTLTINDQEMWCIGF